MINLNKNTELISKRVERVARFFGTLVFEYPPKWIHDTFQ